MRVGLGVLRFPPEVFWSMTVAELTAAAEGRILANGGTLPSEEVKKVRRLQKMIEEDARAPIVAGDPKSPQKTGWSALAKLKQRLTSGR